MCDAAHKQKERNLPRTTNHQNGLNFNAIFFSRNFVELFSHRLTQSKIHFTVEHSSLFSPWVNLTRSKNGAAALNLLFNISCRSVPICSTINGQKNRVFNSFVVSIKNNYYYLSLGWVTIFRFPILFTFVVRCDRPDFETSHTCPHSTVERHFTVKINGILLFFVNFV